jgi:hypothetical protein
MNTSVKSAPMRLTISAVSAWSEASNKAEDGPTTATAKAAAIENRHAERDVLIEISPYDI